MSKGLAVIETERRHLRALLRTIPPDELGKTLYVALDETIGTNRAETVLLDALGQLKRDYS